MIKWISFVILVSLLFCAPVYAERSLTFGVWTQHYAGDHCEGTNNHLVAFESTDGWAGAWFKNSYGNETGFLGYGWHTDKWKFKKDWWVRGNVYAGILAGYGHKHPIRLGMLSPGAYPTASIGYKRYSLEGGALPTFWWLMFKVEF
jgi:hypothetical protein